VQISLGGVGKLSEWVQNILRIFWALVKHRQAVTKLKISAHGLAVETGRYIAMFHTIKVFVNISI
jgi:hypothetical protein